jgi:hypothetical protein
MLVRQSHNEVDSHPDPVEGWEPLAGGGRWVNAFCWGEIPMRSCLLWLIGVPIPIIIIIWLITGHA